MNGVESAVAAEQFLTFRIADERYAVGILSVREILQYGRPTRVPCAPAWIRGVINLRGSVVPVIDLGVKLGLEPSVIVEVRQAEQTLVMGVVADSVDQVIDLTPADVLPPPPFGTRMQVDFLLGMGRWNDGLVLMLDIERVLSTEELLSASAGGGCGVEAAGAASA
jgi:purine-binding chemotaxis protein CheW